MRSRRRANSLASTSSSRTRRSASGVGIASMASMAAARASKFGSSTSAGSLPMRPSSGIGVVQLRVFDRIEPIGVDGLPVVVDAEAADVGDDLQLRRLVVGVIDVGAGGDDQMTLHQSGQRSGVAGIRADL